MIVAVAIQCGSVFQNATENRIRSKRIDYRFKLQRKLIGFQVFPMIGPGCEEAISVKIHISTQMSNQSSLTLNLRALRIAIHPLRLCHGAQRYSVSVTHSRNHIIPVKVEGKIDKAG